MIRVKLFFSDFERALIKGGGHVTPLESPPVVFAVFDPLPPRHMRIASTLEILILNGQSTCMNLLESNH